MAALVKASPTVLAGGVALVRYSISQSAELTINVDAEFVCLATANVENQFRIGSAPPAALTGKPDFLQSLNTYRASRLPLLNDATIVTTAGLKTITGNYVTPIQPTSSASLLIVGADGEILVQNEDGSTSSAVAGSAAGSDGTAGGASGETTVGAAEEGSGQTSSGSIDPGNNYSEVSTSTDWRSLAGSYLVGTVSQSFSFDYLSTTVTVVEHGTGGGFTGFNRATLSNPSNVKGTLPETLDKQFRKSYRTYRNTRGQVKTETTQTAIYVF